jgi:LuxR family transcriptional regulator, maltose regulon positive regulatory protein
MFTSVLATKLNVPLPRAQLILRPCLLERLNEGLHTKLTLISAPAGFGKTTLVSEWVARCNRPVAWLSLDEGDSEPARFVTYLITAVQKVAPNLGAGLLSALQSQHSAPSESMLSALLNEIITITNDFVLVLDDYHLLDAKAVDLALSFLLEHMPVNMHLVITTREDPNLGLARLRASHQLTELRAADLRFTPSETADFLNQLLNIKLSNQQLAILETRTEGWIAGLQLAVISMQDHQDVSGFIRAFAGDDRYIVDYLVEEVLQRQPEATRGFLLQTSILERLNGSL